MNTDRKEKPPTLGGIMKMVEADSRCAKAAIIISILSMLLNILIIIWSEHTELFASHP